MKLIDAHHHIWIPQQRNPDLGYVWLRDIGAMKPFGDPTSIQRDYDWSEFNGESKQHELTGSVFLQVDGAIAHPVAEIAWAQSAIGLPEESVALVGFVDLREDNAQSIIEAQCQSVSFKGVRQILSFLDAEPSLCFASEHLMKNPKWCDQFNLLSENNLSFDLQLYPEQMVEAAEFLALHPNVPVVVDHAGSPHDQSESGLARLQTGLSVLAALPQLSFKLSGFGMFDQGWSSDSIKPIVEIAESTFGFERTMFGSNFPVDKLMASYDDTVNRVLTCVASAGNEAVSAVFEKNARRFYRLS